MEEVRENLQLEPPEDGEADSSSDLVDGSQIKKELEWFFFTHDVAYRVILNAGVEDGDQLSAMGRWRNWTIVFQSSFWTKFCYRLGKETTSWTS